LQPLTASYDQLTDEALAALDLALEERAIERTERRLAPLVNGLTGLVDGVPCEARLLSAALVLSAPGRLVRALRLDAPGTAVAAARLLALPDGAAALLEASYRGRTRRALLLERRRHQRARLVVARRRSALEGLTELEVAAAERQRRRVAARERLRGLPVDDALARSVPAIVKRAARALAEEERAIEVERARCASLLIENVTARSPEDTALLDAFAALARLVAERISIEYRRFERALLKDLRAFAEGARDGEGGVPSPAPLAARRGPLGDRRLVSRLAFLMSKANYASVPRADLVRGFAIGPAPGVRMVVPLSGALAAHFFARGVRMEPQRDGTLAPRFERFAFVWLEHPPGRAGGRSRRRAEGGLVARVKRRLRVALMRDARRRIEPQVRRTIDLVKTLSAAPVASGDAAPPLTFKIFSDVRLGECGLVLPGATIRYRPRDLLLVLGGVLGGVWSKISASPLAILLTARIALPLFGIAAFRGLMGMRRSRVTLDKMREEYENRHLLATRQHAIDSFLREAAETDAKEALVAYGSALVAAIERGEDAGAPLRERPQDLRARVEARLSERAGRLVRFDLEDAIGSLEALGLVAPPGFYAPGETAPDFFDPRVTGEAVKREAETLFAAPPGPTEAAAREPQEGREGVRSALLRMEARSEEPRLGASPAGEPVYPAPEVALLPIDEALRRLRRDLRRLLDLEDAPPFAGSFGTIDAAAARGEGAWRPGERFTL